MLQPAVEARMLLSISLLGFRGGDYEPAEIRGARPSHRDQRLVVHCDSLVWQSSWFINILVKYPRRRQLVILKLKTC